MFFRVDPEFFLFPYLTNKGLIPYAQIADQHFPGGFFLPVNFATMGFSTMESFFTLHLLIICIIGLFIFKITRSLTSVILFVILWPFFDGLHLWIDTFIALSLVSSYYFFLQKKYFLTSLTLAFGLIFKQTILIPILFLSLYSIKVLFFPLLLIFYMFSAFSVKDFWYWTVAFNFTSYNTNSNFDFPKWLAIFIPTVVLIRRHFWIFIFIIFSLPGFFVRPDLVHLQPAAPFLIILFYYLIQSKLKQYVTPTILILSILLVYKLSKLPNKNLYFDENTLKLVVHIKDLASENDEIFLLGAQPHIYTLTNTLPAGKFFMFQLPWYLAGHELRQLQTLEKDTPKLIIFDITSKVDNVPIVQYALRLMHFLKSNYFHTHTIGNYQIYQLKKTY